MGKLTAALILFGLCAWLVPMCAKLDDSAPVAVVPAPLAAAVPAPVAASTVALVSAGTVAPASNPAPKPESKAAPAKDDAGVVIATYRSKKGFPVADGKTLVAVMRTNRSASAAEGVRMTLTVKGSGQVIAKSESKSGEKLDAGASGYAGLNIDSKVFDAVIDGPEEPGTELEWVLTYRLEGDAKDAKRCFALRALPRRRQPEGITWVARGQSNACEAAPASR